MLANEIQFQDHRSALMGHCYRMLGSSMDADDAVQETMVRALKGIERFDGRSALRTWLYRIATNVCLDALSERGRRIRPIEEGVEGSITDELVLRPRTHWLEPVPTAEAIPHDANPAEQAILKESIRLAFVSALQLLPPKQRASLLLTEVLGWSAAEVADSLDTSVASINSALQRARDTLATRKLEAPARLDATQERVLRDYVQAFERYDIDALTALLRTDATFSMPPYSLWLRGPAAVQAWMLGPGAVCRGSRLIAVEACGAPAFAQYHPNPAGGHKPWALIVLAMQGDQIADWISFLDVDTIFPRFGLPPMI